MMENRIQVWDLPLRLFHWLLLAAVAACYLSSLLNPFWLTWHVKAGLWVIALLAFRLVWGFVGSHYARFHNFFPTRRTISAYCKGEWRSAGHNPIGAVWIFCMLFLLSLQSLFGLYALNDELDIQGPLYVLVGSDTSQTLSYWHRVLGDSLPFLILLHVSAIFYHSLIRKRQLVAPMIFGHARNSGQVTVTVAVNKTSLLVALVTAVLVFEVLGSESVMRWLQHVLQRH